jgi:hypothetical protein
LNNIFLETIGIKFGLGRLNSQEFSMVKNQRAARDGRTRLHPRILGVGWIQEHQTVI